MKSKLTAEHGSQPDPLRSPTSFRGSNRAILTTYEFGVLTTQGWASRAYQSASLSLAHRGR